MSAIEEILEKETHTLLERCVVSVWFEGNSRDEEIAKRAADELAAIGAERDEAVTLLEDLNLWLIRSNLGGTAHQRGIALFLARVKTNESIRDSSEPIQND